MPGAERLSDSELRRIVLRGPSEPKQSAASKLSDDELRQIVGLPLPQPSAPIQKTRTGLQPEEQSFLQRLGTNVAGQTTIGGGLLKSGVDLLAESTKPLIAGIEEERQKIPAPISPFRTPETITKGETKRAKEFEALSGLEKTGETISRIAFGALGGGIDFTTQTLDRLVNPEKGGQVTSEAVDDAITGLTDMITNSPDQVGHLAAQIYGTENNPVTQTANIVGSILNFMSGKERDERKKEAINALYSNPEGLLFAIGITKGGVGKATGKITTPKARLAGDIAEVRKAKKVIPKPKIAEPKVEKVTKQPTEAPVKPVEPRTATPAKKPSVEPPKPPKRATPKEAVEQSESLSLKKEEAKTIRRDTGMDKLPEVERKRFDESLNEAKAGNFDKTALATAEGVLKSKRSLSDVEHSGMVIEASRLSNEFELATKEVAKLVDEGNTAGAKKSMIDRDVLFDQLETITRAADFAGTEAGRALSIRRLRINRKNFELSTITRESKAIKGSKLTEAEHGKFGKLVDKHTKLEGKEKTIREAEKQSLVELEKSQAEKIAKREARDVAISKRARGAREKIQVERTDIKKQLGDLGFRVNDVTGLTAEGSFLVGKLAINYMKEGAVTLAEVVRKVKNDIPSLTDRDIYRAINAKDPSRQKKARSEAAKQISDLKSQAKTLTEIDDISNGIFRESRKIKVRSPELQRLRAKLSKLRSEAYRSGMDPKRLTKALDLINELQDQIGGKFRNLKNKRTTVIESAELKGMKEKISELRKTMRAEDLLADLNEQLRAGEFKVDPKPKEVQVSPELQRIQTEIKIARRNIRDAQAALSPKTVGSVIQEVGDFARTVKATADMSATLRQAAVIGVPRPIKLAKATGRGLKAAFSEFSAEQFDVAMRSHPNQFIREKSGLFLSELGRSILGREELFASNLAERIPGFGKIVKGSNRNMVTTLNQLRAAVFDEFLARNPNATHAELSAYANWINLATGRGNLGQFKATGRALGTVFFAPRFAVSRIQTPIAAVGALTGKHGPRVRKAIAKDVAKAGATGLAVLELADLAGLDVTLDPSSSDFGKIKVGNTRIDIWAGIQQPMRVAMRIGLAASGGKTLTGNPAHDSNPVEVLQRFAQYKLSPLVTIPTEVITGRTVVGQKTELSETAMRALVPIVYEDIFEAYKDGGIGRAIVATGLGSLGVGVSTFDKKSKRKRRKR